MEIKTANVQLSSYNQLVHYTLSPDDKAAILNSPPNQLVFVSHPPGVSIEQYNNFMAQLNSTSVAVQSHVPQVVEKKEEVAAPLPPKEVPGKNVMTTIDNDPEILELRRQKEILKQELNGGN